MNGRWTYPNGTYFEGDFENNKPKGMGRWHFHNGNVLEGCYNQVIVPAEDNKSLDIKLAWVE